MSEKRDALVLIDDQAKSIRHYSSELLLGDKAFTPNAQSWLKKKLTDVTIVGGKGVLVGDKVGEVKYIGLDKLVAEGFKLIDL